MTPDRLQDLPLFLLVVRRGGFSAAGAEVGLTRSAVSLAMRRLENRLGVTLFARTTRSVGLTEAGELLRAHAEPLLRALDGSLDAVSDLGRAPSGTLKLSVPRAAFAPALAPLLPRLRKQAPAVRLDIRLEDGLSDIAAEGFDAGVRLGDQIAADMVAVRLTPPIPWQVVASPDYLAARGTPETPEAVLDHDCIGFRLATGGGVAPWAFEVGGRTITVTLPVTVVVDDVAAKAEAARRGLGLAQDLATTFADDVAKGRLVPVLEHVAVRSPGFYLYYPARKQVMPKLRALIDAVRNAGRP
jgi:DNA-binding transcriptional LysR family regulator